METLLKCAFLLPHRLGVPYISYSDFLDPWIARLPWLPSLVPLPLTQSVFVIQDLTHFSNRLLSTLIAIAWKIFRACTNPALPEVMTKYSQYGLNVGSSAELASESLLWLNANDPLLDWHYPSMPHVVDVGGLNIRPGQPLPADLETLLAGSDQGTILVSFGTMLYNLPGEVIQKMITAFQRFPRYTFLWTGGNRSSLATDLPRNVHLRDWVPQNDVLRHANVVLFISHCGKQGIYEAMYHGVPMAAMAITLEQQQNAKLLEARGYGQEINIFDFTSEDLYTNLSDILTTPSFKINAQRASRQFQERPETPRQTGARWVEHVLKYGNEHLKSRAFELSWWSFWLLDVMVTFALSFSIMLCLVWIICWGLCRCCCGQKNR